MTTIVGNLTAINPGESFKLTGRWDHNKKFGEPSEDENCETKVLAAVPKSNQAEL